MSAVGAATGAIRMGVTVGLLATACMDVVFVAASRLGGERFTSDTAGLEPVGRWALGLVHGRCRQDDLMAEPGQPGEVAMGLAVHYSTGIGLAMIYHAWLRGTGRKPDLHSATAYGAATTLLPMLVMYPSWGLGLFGVRSGEALRLGRIILLGHTAFGAAIGIWTMALAGRGARDGESAKALAQ